MFFFLNHVSKHPVWKEWQHGRVTSPREIFWRSDRQIEQECLGLFFCCCSCFIKTSFTVHLRTSMIDILRLSNHFESYSRYYSSLLIHSLFPKKGIRIFRVTFLQDFRKKPLFPTWWTSAPCDRAKFHDLCLMRRSVRGLCWLTSLYIFSNTRDGASNTTQFFFGCFSLNS